MLWGRNSRVTKRRLLAVLTLAVAMGLAATQAWAHVERASYWPDPAKDRSVQPSAGGAVPKARSLSSALRASPPGYTRVVCQGRVPRTQRVNRLKRAVRSARRRHASRRRVVSLQRKLRGARRNYRRGVARNASIRRLKRQIRAARRNGYKWRPSERSRSLSRRQAARLLRINERLLARCAYRSIQPAVTRSRNSDRVVVMPGVYIEPRSRRKPTHDPKCADLRILNDRSGGRGTGALSYAYQAKCPNDANLIAVTGRREGTGKDPQPPLVDRHGIPNLGACLRCNLQLEGSGVSSDGVVVDAGRVKSGNGGPAEAVKDVGIFVDRADGFVLRGMTIRHVAEHGIYVLETDGYLLERFKAFYADEYGLLTFVGDHALIRDCEAAGSGDAGLYPGSAADTGQQTIEPKQRLNTELRDCDSHHNSAGYSGTASNAVHINHNNFYDNALGFTTDVFTASGHPGFPQDSDLIENNNFYSNNFNPYEKGSDVTPTIPVPVGTGLWIAGGNANTIRNNHFWDNRRRGVMIFTVPDSFVCGDTPVAGGNHQAGCKENGGLSTSFDNRVHDNVMGRRPDGTRDPNGVDFWWDQFPNQHEHNPPTTTGNCWYSNTGKDGNEASITSQPGRPLLPSNCKLSLGTSSPQNETELLNCFADFDDDTPDVAPCDWFVTPPDPK